MITIIYLKYSATKFQDKNCKNNKNFHFSTFPHKKNEGKANNLQSADFIL